MPSQEIFKMWVSEIAFPAFWEHNFKKISASQNKVLMVKFVINCIQTQNKFNYADQQILFFKRLFNVKLIYSIQVLGPWLWGNMPFVFFSGGAEEGAQWPAVGQIPHHSMVLKNALQQVVFALLVPSCCNKFGTSGWHRASFKDM